VRFFIHKKSSSINIIFSIKLLLALNGINYLFDGIEFRIKIIIPTRVSTF
jgi:hypothetical protein